VNELDGTTLGVVALGLNALVLILSSKIRRDLKNGISTEVTATRDAANSAVAKLDDHLLRIERRFDVLDRRFDSMDGRLAKADERIDKLTEFMMTRPCVANQNCTREHQ
jgi:hypothetical protein